jgi:hypothetical protein
MAREPLGVLADGNTKRPFPVSGYKLVNISMACVDKGTMCGGLSFGAIP